MLRKSKNDKESYPSLPRKSIRTAVLLFYKHDLLIVRTADDEGWTLPGGTVAEEESPLEGLHREVHQKLAVSIKPRELLSIDYISNFDVDEEYIYLLFAAESLTEMQAQQIQLFPYETLSFRFVNLEQALELLNPHVAKRVLSTLASQAMNGGAVYLENGISISDITKHHINIPV